MTYLTLLHPANHNILHQVYETIYTVIYNQIETIYMGKGEYKHFLTCFIFLSYTEVIHTTVSVLFS